MSPTAHPADAYASVDHMRVRRVTAALCLIIATAVVVALPFAPPSGGTSGIALVLAVAALRAGTGVWIFLGRGPIDYTHSFRISLVNMAGLCLCQWLAGTDAPYAEILLLDLVGMAAVHPPRRAAIAFLVASAGLVPAAARAGWESVAVADWVMQTVVWGVLAAVTLHWTRRDRRTLASADALARVDELTGLGNRRAFDETLGREVARARRQDRSFSLLVADLQRFKAVNDRFGHPAGDALLAAVAAELDEAVRVPDTCFRWGGDEFAILLSDADADAAGEVAARITASVSAACTDPGGRPARLLFGAAQLGGAMTPEDLVAAADEALLERRAGLPASR